MTSPRSAQTHRLLAGPIAARKHRTPLGDTIATLRRKPLAIGGFVVVMVWLILGITAPILPIADPNAQNMSERLQAPSLSTTSVLMSLGVISSAG